MTKRERRSSNFVSDGMTNRKSAGNFTLSFHKKSHVHNILEKLAIHNRIEIARYAHEDQGLMT